MIMNAVPVLNSDGYRILLAICDVSERRKREDNPAVVRVIGVVSVMIAAAYVFSLVWRLVGAWM